METVITITLKDGQLAVTGPLDNKLLMYGLLEAAKDIVRASKDQQRIVPAPILFKN